MWDVKAAENGTKINQNPNTRTLVTEDVSMKAIQLTTNPTKAGQNGSTRGTAAHGKAWKTRISHQ